MSLNSSKELVALLLLLVGALPMMGQKPESIPEEIEWTWEMRPPHPDLHLPNVLLLGDFRTIKLFRSNAAVCPEWRTRCNV